MIVIHDILDVKNYISEIDAVIFDLDDTLYSEKLYIKSGYKKIAEYFKVPGMENELWLAFEQGKRAIDEVLQRHHLQIWKTEALKIYRYQDPDIYLYYGVADMIKNFRKNKKVGLITDGRPEGQRAKIRALKLDTLFDYIIITDELGGINFRKPCPVAFQIMSENLGVKFNRMCYIGDNK